MERTNLSYYTVPAAWVVSLIPHFYAIARYDRVSKAGKFDRVNPRLFVASVEDNKTIESSLKRKIIRAEGAQLNGFENLGFFAGAVVAANTTGVDVWWLNVLSMAYVFNRALYNIVYIKGVAGPVRGLPYYAAVACAITLYIKAGNVANRQG
ncbi:hypothetical protein H2204_003671 [Knufia peltigerae]|uniref:MAPEG family protein n=1 Tax=Knufia peltigerae TaxID=1002370 RepID=A0AA38Y8P6_9EURO|nr:hypothetical protein H2204_003671 [Knufia peltigerae]